MVSELRDAKKTEAKVSISFSFEPSNPNAADWASKHTAELIDGISKTTREDLRVAFEAAFEEGRGSDDLYDVVLGILGDEERADLIARTETMLAANMGQLQAWEQAVEQGFLPDDTKKVWIVTPADALCSICRSLRGAVAALYDGFNASGDIIDGPPAHPRCRCALGISG